MILIPVTPVPKPRMTRADRWKKRPCVVRYWAFKDALRASMEEQKVPMEFTELNIIFMVPMPKSWSKKKKKEMDNKPHQQRADLDNYLKAFLDCIMSEDCAVWEVYARKVWSTEGGIVLR
jgi:Holliday junction resolvase RusA-like endonuclease